MGLAVKRHSVELGHGGRCRPASPISHSAPGGQEPRDPARLVVPRIGPRPVQPWTLALWDAAERSVFECR